jgi:hypothetical protein
VIMHDWKCKLDCLGLGRDIFSADHSGSRNLKIRRLHRRSSQCNSGEDRYGESDELHDVR